MSTSRVKRPKRTAGSPPCAVLRRVLPSPLLRNILQFVPFCAPRRGHVAPMLHSDVVPEAPSPVPPRLKDLISHVSPEYEALMDDLTAQYERAVLHVRIASSAEREVAALHTSVARVGETLECLRIDMGERRPRVFRFASGLADVEIVDSLGIDWNRVFSCCPNLQRLDLRNTPLHSRQLADALEAASHHCKNLVALLLPPREASVSTCGLALLPLMETLNRVIRRWFETGTVGGLRQLHVPQRITACEDRFVEFNDAFLLTVAQCCPNLEYLDGYNSTFHADESMYCEEFLCCSLGVWEEFCKSCTKLRELNWFVVPYLDPFFEIWAKYPKPQLTELVVAGGDHVNFINNEAGYYDKPMDYTWEGIVKVLEGCPALKHLEVLYMQEEDDYRRHNLFNDRSVVALSTACPLLETLRFAKCNPHEPFHMISLCGGHVFLTAMEHLRKVEFPAANIEWEDMFEWLETAPLRGRTREATFGLVDNWEDSDVSDFRYATMRAVLERVVERADDLRGRLFDVTLRNVSYYEPFAEGHAVVFTKGVRKLVEQLRAGGAGIGVEIRQNLELVEVDRYDGVLDRVSSMRFFSPTTIRHGEQDEGTLIVEW